jgi:hypothetical protein
VCTFCRPRHRGHVAYTIDNDLHARAKALAAYKGQTFTARLERAILGGCRGAGGRAARGRTPLSAEVTPRRDVRTDLASAQVRVPVASSQAVLTVLGVACRLRAGTKPSEACAAIGVVIGCGVGGLGECGS